MGRVTKKTPETEPLFAIEYYDQKNSLLTKLDIDGYNVFPLKHIVAIQDDHTEASDGVAIEFHPTVEKSWYMAEFHGDYVNFTVSGMTPEARAIFTELVKACNPDVLLEANSTAPVTDWPF